MSALAPTLQAWFTDRLMNQRDASPHTIAAYRDTMRLLLAFNQQHTCKQPSALDVEDLDATRITAFLGHLEHERLNSPRTLNARLAAIHSLFRYAALRHPEHSATIARVLAIPSKRFDRAIVAYLTPQEVDALLDAPDRNQWIGRRDHALMTLCIQTGLRVSELTALRVQDVQLTAGPHVQVTGKGRKQRAIPLTSKTVAVLRGWMPDRAGKLTDALFPSIRGTSLSRDAVALLLAKHTGTASHRCATLKNKKVSPHVLRHTAAMNLLHAESTARSLPCGSATSRSKPRSVTSTRTCPSRNEHLPGPPHRIRDRDATALPMSCSRSSTASDYAES